MNRDLLAAKAEGYRKGREELMQEYVEHAIIRIGDHTYILSELAEKEADRAYQNGLEEGRKEGIAMERTRIHKVEWSKLGRMILNRSIIGSVIGCGIILAVAIGLSRL